VISPFRREMSLRVSRTILAVFIGSQIEIEKFDLKKEEGKQTCLLYFY
jgi:hypothetical protein